MKKPLAITSPNNAVALSVYFILGLAGLFYTLGVTSSATMSKAVPDGVLDVWSTTLMLTSWGALAAAVSAKKSSRPEINLKFEMWTAFGLGLNLAYFIYAILLALGMSSWGSVTFALAFCVGGLWRGFQIKHELKLIKAARHHPEAADPVMADPRDEHE